MGFARQYKALLYKNILLKTRSPCASAAELILPIIFILVMVGLYRAFPDDRFDDRMFVKRDLQNREDVKFVSPFAILPTRLRLIRQKLALVSKEDSADLKAVRDAFIEDMNVLHPGLDGETVGGTGFNNSVLRSRLKLRAFKDEIMTFDSESQLESYVRNLEYDTNWERNSTQFPKIWGAIVFNRVGGGSASCGRIFGASPRTGACGNGDFDYSLRLNASQVPQTSGQKVDVLARGYLNNTINSYVQSRLQTEGPPFLRDIGDFITLLPFPGFLTIQREIDRWVINRPTSPANFDPTVLQATAIREMGRVINPFTDVPLLVQEAATRLAANPADPVIASLFGLMRAEAYAPQHVEFVPFPVGSYQQNGFYNLVLFILSFVLVVVLSLPASRFTRSLVLEKEMKLREGMRMMGLMDSAYYAAYITYGAIFYGIMSLIIALITRTTIFKSTAFGLVFLHFFLFGMATLSFALLVSVFFSRAKTASALSVLLYIGAYFPAFSVSPEFIAFNTKRAASLLHCTAFGLGIDLIGKWEDSGAGLDVNNAAVVLNNWSLNTSLGMLVLDFFLYLGLALYIDAVLPARFREYGVPRPWYFPVSPDFWREILGYPSSAASSTPTAAKSSSSSGGFFGLFGARSAAAAPAPSGGRIGPDPTFLEEADANLKAKEREGRCVSVSKLRKEFPTPDGIKVAVDGVDLTMYEGQIFVLLGHNGAGKSTTISMLTGLIPPTSGTADIFGKKVLDTTQLSAIRKELGVCPQYDVLWPELTVSEHLSIFMDIKGVPLDKKQAEIDKAIVDVGLTEKVRTQSRALSGGQKRKLSVCIALAGGSKVVFLDEPTSGMDPYSRRSTWQILQNAREGRVIILTTHFMDEADILGDRIAIMAEGRVECAGSPMFLKKRYGVGYVLTLVKQQSGPGSVDKVLDLIKRHVPETTVATNVGAELSLRLPLSSSPAFPAMLAELDASLAAVGVASYGISITSIEDVFLKISHGSAHEQEAAAAAQGATATTVIQVAAKSGSDGPVSTLVPSTPAPDKRDGSSGSLDEAIPTKGGAAEDGASKLAAVRAAARAEQTGLGTFFRHFTALIIKRWQYTTRDGKALLYQLFLPAILIAIGLVLINVGTAQAPESYQLSTAQFNTDQRVDANKPRTVLDVPVFQFKGGKTVDSPALTSFFQAMPASNVSITARSYADVQAITSPADWLATATGSPLSEHVRMSAYLLNSRGERAASRYGAYLLNTEGTIISPAAHAATDVLTNGDNVVTASIFFNSTGFHTPAVFLNLLNSRIYSAVTGNPSAAITARNHPLPQTDRQKTLFAGLLVFSAAIIMVIAFSFVASSMALFVTREREVSAKHQQFISGVSVPAYWMANFVFDLAAYYVPAVLALVLCAAFRINEFISPDFSRRPALILTFLLYGPALVSFTYCITFLFKNPSSASSSVLFGGVLVVILIAACQFMSQIESTCRAEVGLRYVFRLIPTFSWGWNLIQLAFLNTLPLIDATCDRFSGITRPPSDYDPYDALSFKANGTGLLFLAFEGFFFFGLVLAIEYVQSQPALRQYFTREQPVQDPPYEEDDDVIEEAKRVDAQMAKGVTDSVVVSHLRKVYPADATSVPLKDRLLGKKVEKTGKVAVKNLSFGIPVGEVFGFLGINGAGKTTTLEILSGDILPSTGGAKLAGYDILTQQPEVRRLLGYCPQFEALLEFLSVREHLQLYARIKGVPERQVPVVVETKLQEMDLKRYENKLAGSLSGGNKRKLSVAIALIGSPPIVFLDEPSTGMDPVARRFMWRVISRVATEQKQCSIILTTHSMEEVEALCTRIGIMVGGRLRCLGNAQHLRNRHGKGFQCEVKISSATPEGIAHTVSVIAKALGGDNVTTMLPSQVSAAAAALGNPARGAQVTTEGSGWPVAAAFARSTAPGHAIAIADFASWWADEQVAKDVADFICTTAFPGSFLLERNGSVMRFRVMSEEPLATLFLKLESTRKLGVISFTLGQTTLEQIFVQFAAQQEEEKGVARGFAGATASSNPAQGMVVADDDPMDRPAVEKTII